jgi:hypothetical protein
VKAACLILFVLLSGMLHAESTPVLDRTPIEALTDSGEKVRLFPEWSLGIR